MIPTNRHPWKGNCENDTPQQDPENSLRLQAQMLDHIGQAVIATNLAGRVIYANRAACTVYRRPHGEVIGAHILEVMTPLAMGEHTDEIIGCFERCESWNGEIIVRRHDTTIFPITLNSAPVFDSTGKIVGLIGISTDISERKRNEHQWTVLSRLGRGLNSAQKPRDAAMLIVEAADELFGWDAAIVQHYDATNDLLSSILTIDIIDGKKMPYEETGTWTPSPRTRKVLKEGPLLILRTTDDKPESDVQMFGTTTKISRSIMMVPIRNGPDIIGALSIQSYRINAYTKADLELFQMFADYGAGALNRISAEAQRRGAEQLLAEQAALLDIAHDGIVARDLEDKIVYWNKGAENTYGWTAREMLGKKSIDIHIDKTKFAEAFTCVAKNGEWSGEIPQTAKDGRTLTMQVRWTLVRDGDGKPKGILGINTDVTEKKKLEGQILRTQRIESIGTLAGGIAHDLNNVLAPILMAVHMLRESTENAKQRHILDTLEKSSQRGADLVRQVLTFARGVEGKRSAVNVRSLADNLDKVIHDTFPKNIKYKLDSDEDLWTIEADPTQIEQVLMNLCVNARDAMPDGGRLTIHVRNIIVDEAYARMNPDGKPGPYLVITVEDNGTGMPPDVLDKIFDPFFTTKEVGKGTGLGLATVLTIVKSHQGFINVYSESGKGSRFKVFLPASPSQAAEERLVIEQTQLPRGNGELIMIVDDEESIRHITQETLECFGYRTLQANNGAQAVALYAQHRDRISVVITDMTMPVMDGAAAITALRSINPHIKIIASSGLGSGDGAGKAATSGVHYFVPKPYTAERLLKILRKVITG